MKSLIPIYISVLLLSACSKPEEAEINANKVIESVKAMAKLGTTEYTFNKVVAGQDNQWIGSRKFIMTCKAHVIAGIDASQIQFTDVKPKEKSIKLTIPAVELITFDLPSDEFTITDEEVDTFRKDFTNQEWEKIQQKAEKAIREDLKKYNIKVETEKNAKLFLDRLLRSAGFIVIEINTSPDGKF